MRPSSPHNPPGTRHRDSDPKPPIPRAGVTRLAPSPTGALHLGNARTFLVNWILARQKNWRIVMRIEDLDSPRVKPDADRGMLDTLRWLGLDWDEGPTRQSRDLAPYARAMQRLAHRRLVYPCDLSRAEIDAAASAPHGTGESRFPPELRPRCLPHTFDDPSRSWRIVVPDRDIGFHDEFHGTQSHNPGASVGDFVVWTKRAAPAYQLAVVVDDIAQHVTDVVRGDDLLDSAARQILIYRALDAPAIPRWTHLPLVRGHDGRRLAKRHGDTRLMTYRRRGVRPQRILGLLARWCAITDPHEPMREVSIEEATERFRLDSMSRRDIVFTPEDEAWLTAS